MFSCSIIAEVQGEKREEIQNFCKKTKEIVKKSLARYTVQGEKHFHHLEHLFQKARVAVKTGQAIRESLQKMKNFYGFFLNFIVK